MSAPCSQALAALSAEPNHLHGLFVLPAHHGHGIGAELVHEAITRAGQAGATTLLVKAERHAVGFFVKQGFRLVKVVDPATDYPHRLSLAIG